MKILENKDGDIKCKCGKLLAKMENGWLKINGETSYSSNGTVGIFFCKRCERKTELKLIK